MPLTEVLTGAALGLILQILHQTIQRSKDKSATAKCILGRLDATIVKITPLVVKIEELGKKSDEPLGKVVQDLTRLLKKAVVLVNASIELKRRNLLKKHRYKRSIKELESSLRWMVEVDLQVNLWADIKELVSKMSDMNTKLDEITREPVECFTLDEGDNSNHNKVETGDPSLEAKDGSDDGLEPKIDINLRWTKKQTKKGEIRLVFH